MNSPYSSQLRNSHEYFVRSTKVLDEADSSFRPKDGTMTAAQQVAHVAMTVDWFIQGASRPEGFDLDFETGAKELEKVTSLKAARAMLDTAYAKAIEWASSKTPEDLAKPLPPGPVMGGVPISGIFEGIIDHSAHHRGALTIYSRLLGKTPAMPYADM